MAGGISGPSPDRDDIESLARGPQADDPVPTISETDSKVKDQSKGIIESVIAAGTTLAQAFNSPNDAVIDREITPVRRVDRNVVEDEPKLQKAQRDLEISINSLNEFATEVSGLDDQMKELLRVTLNSMNGAYQNLNEIGDHLKKIP